MFNTYAQVWLTPQTCAEGYAFNPKEPILPIPKNFQYTIPKGTELAQYRDFIDGFPEIDSPEILGLHPNADLTFRLKEVGSMLTTLGETQPKGGGGGGGESREDIVLAKSAELLERLPEQYNEDDYKAKIQKLGGLSVPLNIFLFQEVQRLADVLAKVKFMLGQLQLAIKGEVVMTGELQGALDRMAAAAVPHTWTFTPAGDEFSWIMPTLGLWFSSLISRDDQDRSWLNTGRPNCYWMTGWFNPTGFLTAMKQEVTRKHKADKWALDDVVYRTETQPKDRPDQVTQAPAEGVYVHGLQLDGAAFSKKDGILEESEPKKLFSALPVLYVSGIIKDQMPKLSKELFGAHGPYDCPVYKYRPRTDRFFIFFVTLKCTVDKNKKYWDLRGTALLENID
jgi:dynein heavy chain